MGVGDVHGPLFRLHMLLQRRWGLVGVDYAAGGVDIAIEGLRMRRQRERGNDEDRRCNDRVSNHHEWTPAQDATIPLWRRSASSCGGRPRKATNDSSAGRLPPR